MKRKKINKISNFGKDKKMTIVSDLVSSSLLIDQWSISSLKLLKEFVLKMWNTTQLKLNYQKISKNVKLYNQSFQKCEILPN